MTGDPYKVLGVGPDATEEEIKAAYLELVKKYHPDKYQGNPLADLAEEKLQEVNEAYDALKEMGDGRNAYGPQGSGYDGTAGGNPGYVAVRQALDMNDLERAEQLLINMRDHDGEWFFLSGVLQFKRGFFQNGMANVERAMELEPGNQEYRAIYRQMAGAGNMYRARSDRYGYDQSRNNGDALCWTLPLCFCLPNPFCWC